MQTLWEIDSFGQNYLAGYVENNLEVLHLDESVCVINKPSGHVVHKTRGAEDSPVVLQSLRDQIDKRVFPVHRLDRGTSGCLAFALSPEVASGLQLSLQQGHKKYQALCLGRLDAEGQIDRELTGENKAKQSALTKYRKIQQFEEYSLLELEIFTGRKHQIRRHLSFLGHHVIGDVNHGKGWLNRKFREQYDFHRLFLHCHILELLHPVTGEKLSIHCELPIELKKLLSALP